MVCKCVKCGFEWNSRSESPRQCPDCDSRQWRQIDAELSSPVVGQGDDRILSSPAIVSLSSPVVVTRDRVPNQSPRLCLHCDWKSRKPTSDNPEESELSQFARHSATHNPSPAQWSDAHQRILAQRPRKAA
jgi:hypothetical protein